LTLAQISNSLAKPQLQFAQITVTPDESGREAQNGQQRSRTIRAIWSAVSGRGLFLLDAVLTMISTWSAVRPMPGWYEYCFIFLI
jgi:hypothetical protein